MLPVFVQRYYHRVLRIIQNYIKHGLFSLHLEIDVRDNQELMELIFPIDAIYDF